MKIANAIPAPQEIKTMIQGLRLGQQPNRLRFLRGLIYQGALAKGVGEMEATKMALGADVLKLGRRLKFNVSSV